MRLRSWSWSRARRSRDERGAVAIMVAVSMIVLLVATAMVLDFGQVRLDRQHLKAVADSAALTGIAAGDGATGDVYTYRAVCGALDSLKTSEPFKPDGSYTGLPAGVCANLTPNLNVKCNPASPAAVTYDATVTRGGATYRVVIQSPYLVSSGGWSEENLPAVSGDVSVIGGCDQLGVQIFESRKPGLGSLATSSNLRFGIRSASRASLGGEDAVAPALIILERTACSALTVGSASQGEIYVKGIAGTPGSIHLDSDATGPDCGSGSNQQLVQGKHADGIVAFGSTSTGIAGVITAVALARGRASNIVYDTLDNVYGTTATSLPSTGKLPVGAKELVGRAPVDVRYRAGVRTAITGASTATNGWAGAAPDASWTTVNSCNSLNAAQLAAPKLYINCTNNSGFGASGVIQASQVYLNGFFKNGNLAMPNATRVYIRNTSSSGGTINSAAITITNGNGFCVQSTSCAVAPVCTGTPTLAPRAQVFVRRGSVNAGGGVLRLCNSTLIMLGGDSTAGCVPATDGALPPTTTPCTTSPSSGDGQVDVGAQATLDWSAPNTTTNTATPAQWAAQEDLALWSESAGLFKFTGAGTMSTFGVFMTPNGNVSVGGGSSQLLFNSQYIARTFGTGGQGSLTLITDPRSAVTIPSITGYLLIR